MSQFLWISVHKLAKLAGITPSNYGIKESGKHSFNLIEVTRLSDHFHLTLEELINGRHIEPPTYQELGLSSEAIRCLQEFWARNPESMDGLNTILSSPHILHLIASYMILPEADGAYSPPEKVTQTEDGQYKMDLTLSSLNSILESAIVQAIREIHEQK